MIESIRECLEATIFMSLVCNSQIDVHIHVLQADGSVFATVLNAITLAIIDAGIPIRDYLCASSIGLYDSHMPILGTMQIERSFLGLDLEVYIV
jgi:exosome complex component RRP41